jgi:hypothetical protein
MVAARGRATASRNRHPIRGGRRCGDGMEGWGSGSALGECVLIERLDHDALTGAFLGSFDNDVELVVRNAGYAAASVRSLFTVEDDVGAPHRGSFLDNPKTVIARLEYVRCDLFTDSITGAKILIDPHHQRCVSHALPWVRE